MIDVIINRLRKLEINYKQICYIASNTVNLNIHINEQIEYLNSKGGGLVKFIDPIYYINGPIKMKSNVSLFINESSELIFSTDPSNYLPYLRTRWQGIDCYNYQGCITAVGANNISIFGGGVINGNSSFENWWSWSARSNKKHQISDFLKLREMVLSGVDINLRQIKNSRLRPPLMQFVNCSNIHINGIECINSPMWNIHLLNCSYCLIDGVFVNSLGPNNDGVDIDSSNHIVVINSSFHTGDDCISFKCGRYHDFECSYFPTFNCFVRNCTMTHGHSGIAFGSENYNNIFNINITKCIFDGEHLERAIGFKSNKYRCGTVNDVVFYKNRIGLLKDCMLRVDFRYRESEEEKIMMKRLITNFLNVSIEDVKVTSNIRLFKFRFSERKENIKLRLLNNYLEDEIIHQLLRNPNIKLEMD